GHVRARSDLPREVADRDGDVGPDVVRTSRRAAREDGPQPADEIGRIEVRTERRAVALHDDRLSLQRLADEVSEREVGVEWEERPGECEPARDREGPQLLGDALALAVRARGPARIVLRHALELGRLH